MIKLGILFLVSRLRKRFRRFKVRKDRLYSSNCVIFTKKGKDLATNGALNILEENRLRRPKCVGVSLDNRCHAGRITAAHADRNGDFMAFAQLKNEQIALPTTFHCEFQFAQFVGRQDVNA